MLQDHNAFRLAISASLSDWSLTGSDIDTTGSRKLTSGILLKEVLIPNTVLILVRNRNLLTVFRFFIPGTHWIGITERGQHYYK